MHGRDINYANRIVAAKVWAALFAVGNWAEQVQVGKKEKPDEGEKKTTWKEVFQQLQNNEIKKKIIAQWKARKLKVGKDFSQTGTINDYEKGTPEKAFVEFLDLINKKNYGEIAKRVTNLQSFSQGKKAGELRNKFKNIHIQKFTINEIRDEAPAISEVVVVLDYKNDNQKYSKEITARMIFQDDNNSPLVRGFKNGSWKILEWCFDSICY